MLSLSHQVHPAAPEFERTSTTVVNAYVGPKVNRYLERLDEQRKASGYRQELLVMQSSGGMATAAPALRPPLPRPPSGPAVRGGRVAVGGGRCRGGGRGGGGGAARGRRGGSGVGEPARGHRGHEQRDYPGVGGAPSGPARARARGVRRQRRSTPNAPGPRPR